MNRPKQKRRFGQDLKDRNTTIVWLHVQGFSTADICLLWGIHKETALKAIRVVAPKPKLTAHQKQQISREYKLAWRVNNQERRKANGAAYYQRNKEKQNAKNAAWRAANKELSNAFGRKSTRKILGILNATGESRSGTCPICLREGPLHCDHYHSGSLKGHVRGWICGTCNRGIGSLRDSVENLNRAITYLKGPP